jgi:hypothetical protein
MLLASRLLAQEGEQSAAPIPHVEIDRSALSIDIAAHRRALDSSIRRELARGVAAHSDSRLRELATARQRPRG